METENGNVKQAEDAKLLANEAYKGKNLCFYNPSYLFFSFNLISQVWQ